MIPRSIVRQNHNAQIGFFFIVAALLLLGQRTAFAQDPGPLKLTSPSGIAVDSENHIYVSDPTSNRIVYISSMEEKEWLPCGGSGQAFKKTRMPLGIAVDSKGRIYFADAYQGEIVRLEDRTGEKWTALKNSAVSLALSGQGDLIALSSRVMVFDSELKPLNGSYGKPGKGKGQFNNASGIAMDSGGRIYIADTHNNRIVKIDDLSGSNWETFGDQGIPTEQLRVPAGIALDSQDRIYVADSGNNRIVRIDEMHGTNFLAYGRVGSDRGEFMSPFGIAIDSADRIYVTDQLNNRIVRIDNMNGDNWRSLGD